ncbi:MAG: aspartyl protease family protein [Patescibacteria group bacterium]
MKFPYAKFGRVGSEIIKRPVVPIEVKFEDETVLYDALIDSGADICIFDAAIGEQLGINIISGIPIVFGGAEYSKGSAAYLHQVKIKIKNKEIKTQVAFTYNIANHGHGLLGQKGFFDKFAIKFDYSNDVVDISSR